MGIVRKGLENIVAGTANTAGAALDLVEGAAGASAMATPAAIAHMGTTYGAQSGAGFFTNFLYPLGNSLGLVKDSTLLQAKAGKLSYQAMNLASDATGYSIGTLANAAYAGLGFLGVPYAVNKVGDALQKLTPGTKLKKIVRGTYDAAMLTGALGATALAYTSGLPFPGSYAAMAKPVLVGTTARLGGSALYKGGMRLLKGDNVSEKQGKSHTSQPRHQQRLKAVKGRAA